jgi:branched-chain amino acid transport system substrate-binding protein
VALALIAITAGCGSQHSTEDFAAVYAADASSSENTENADNASSRAGDDTTADPDALTEVGTDTGAVVTSDGGTTGGGSTGGATATGGGSTGGGAAGPAARGAPIKIGSVGTLSGPVGSAIGNGAPGVQAWVASINAKGGIKGHPVQLFVADDGGDPARHRALVQDMVERKGVVAFVQNAAALSGQSVVSYLEDKKIPVVGSEAGSPWFNSSPMMFPQQASDARLAQSFAAGYAQVAKELGFTRIALISCAEISGCQTSTQGGPFRAAGLDVVYEARASLAQPSYTSQCLTARDKGAQIVLVGLDAQSAQRIADNCASVNFRPRWGIVPQAVTSVLLKRPSMEGGLVILQTAPWFQSSIPAVAEFQQAMRQFAPAVEQNGSSIQGWTSAKMFESAANKGGDPTTSAGILEGLYALNGDDLGGLTYPLRFTKGAPNNAGASQPCWWDVRMIGGKFVSPDNGARHCP